MEKVKTENQWNWKIRDTNSGTKLNTNLLKDAFVADGKCGTTVIFRVLSSDNYNSLSHPGTTFLPCNKDRLVIIDGRYAENV